MLLVDEVLKGQLVEVVGVARLDVTTSRPFENTFAGLQPAAAYDLVHRQEANQIASWRQIDQPRSDTAAQLQLQPT
jgi:hypothetical protein